MADNHGKTKTISRAALLQGIVLGLALGAGIGLGTGNYGIGIGCGIALAAAIMLTRATPAK